VFLANRVTDYHENKPVTIEYFLNNVFHNDKI
jgi:hypothetical protein